MNKYELFLKQKNYNNEILKTSKLRKVVVDEEKNIWYFTIELDDFVDADLLFTFTKTIKDYFKHPNINFIDVRFIHLNDKNFEKYALNYFERSLRYIGEIKPSFLALENFEVTFENNQYLIHIDKSSLWIEEYIPEMALVFDDINIKPTIKVLIDEELETLNEKIDERVKTRTDRLKEIRQPKKEVVAERTFRKRSSAEVVPISKIPLDQLGLDKYLNENGTNFFIVEGEIFEINIRAIKNFHLLEMIIADELDAITIKSFIYQPRDLEFAEKLKPGQFIQAEGEAKFDTFSQDVTIITNKYSLIEGAKQETRKDRAKEKRVELHVHTKMSDLDGIADAKDYIERAIHYGHKAIAFTDHNGVYAFPDIYNATKGKDIKPIYGVELDVVNSDEFIVLSGYNEEASLSELTYVVFDIESTGLSATNDSIIEIGAVKIKKGEIIDRFQSFINPEVPLSEFIKNFTGITDEDLMDAKKIDEVLPEFINFIEDAILVAHNASFDINFIKEKAENYGYQVNNDYIDTLNLARYFYYDKIKRFNLKALSKHFKVELENHHRADEDAEATSQIWLKMIYDLKELNIKTNKELLESIKSEESYKHMFPYHVTVLAKNQDGYKDLFKIVSKALTDNYYDGPRTLKSTLDNNRKNILIGSACDKGEVFDTALNGRYEKLVEVIKYYDYIEVQPPSSYQHLIDKMENGYEIITGVITKIIKTAKSLDKIVVATGNAHYLDETDDFYRKIYVRAPITGGGLHPLFGVEDLPKQYYRTTNEMLEEFDFLEENLAKEIVVTNTNLINNQISHVKAFPDELYSLPDDAFVHIGVKSIKVETEKLVYEEARKLYGKNLHPIVKERIEKELDSIIGNKFAPIYYISHLLVKKSLEDGYLVGSRGSVGSSFIATLMNITEVNPLKPHYRCKNGDFTVFNLTNDEIYKYGISEEEKEFQKYFEGVQSGFDLPDQNCPNCNSPLIKDGHDIPFETFLGFKGDKVPDIDLNFSGDYQATAHSYIRELLGEDYSFRAGTISTVADRTAYGYVMNFLDENQIRVRKAQVNRIVNKIKGVKRSTGQHPGGIVVVPRDKTIYDITPIQYPANDTSSSWYTTHFDYHAFEDNLLKLDVLGHDDPTMIKFLMDEVKKNPDDFPFEKATDIPLADKNVLKMFSETNIIGVKEDDILSEVASYGIPEFGTPFTREMLNETKPDSFAGLVKISGLSHGTDVWLKNARDLINGGTEFKKIDFNDIIACRDDIMVQLTEMGLEPLKAFDIMEFVRKGRPSKDLKTWGSYVTEMEKHNVPKWYIWSASQIKYMFPKAHATAYVIMALRIAWFKLYSPLLFYSAFFSTRAVQFDYESMVIGNNAIKNKLRQLEEIPIYQRKVKDNDLIVTLGVALEMVKRGFKFLPVSIEKSEAKKFVIEDDGLRMPFVSVDGLGEQVALGIVEARNEREFSSVEDVLERTRINKTVNILLEEYGAYGKLKEKDEKIMQGLFANL